MTSAEWPAIPVAVVASIVLVYAWIKFRTERFALPEWRRSFGLVGWSLTTIAWSLFVTGYSWVGSEDLALSM